MQKNVQQAPVKKNQAVKNLPAKILHAPIKIATVRKKAALKIVNHAFIV